MCPDATDRSNTESSPPPLGADCALFLDIDGTLLEIASTPEGVRVTAGLAPLLTRLISLFDGAVALISGRATGDIDRLFPISGLSLAALHGLERRDATGLVHRAANGRAVAPVRGAIEAFAAQHDGVRVEDKGAAIALHFRQSPAIAEQAHAFIAEQLRNHSDLDLLRGKMVIEVKPKNANKGSAIDAFMAESPFRGRTPVFIGDDVTDEDGFAVVNRLGGWSVRVGAAERTNAQYTVADVSAVLALLGAVGADHSKVEKDRR